MAKKYNRYFLFLIYSLILPFSHNVFALTLSKKIYNLEKKDESVVCILEHEERNHQGEMKARFNREIISSLDGVWIKSFGYDVTNLLSGQLYSDLEVLKQATFDKSEGEIEGPYIREYTIGDTLIKRDNVYNLSEDFPPGYRSHQKNDRTVEKYVFILNQTCR